MTLGADGDGTWLAGSQPSRDGRPSCAALASQALLPGGGSVSLHYCPRNPSGHALPLGHGGQSLGVFMDSGAPSLVQEGALCRGPRLSQESWGHSMGSSGGLRGEGEGEATLTRLGRMPILPGDSQLWVLLPL